MGKDRKYLYASGILQQNLNNNFKHIKDQNGPLYYPTSHMVDTVIFHRTDNNSLDFGRIGTFIKAEKIEVESYLGKEHISAYNDYPTYMFRPDDISEHVQN